MTQVPNIVLNTNWIENVSRSKAMREQLLMYISFDTTLEDIQLLKNEMQAFVLDKENSRDFQTDIDVEVTGISEMNKMELKVEIRHKVRRNRCHFKQSLTLIEIVKLGKRSRKSRTSL